MARATSMVVRAAESVDRNAKMRRIVQQGGPTMFEFLFFRAKPNLVWLGHGDQIVDMPMRCGSRFQVVTNPRAESSGTEGAAYVGVKTGNNIKGAQTSNFKTLHLRHRRDQDIGSLVLGQIHGF